MLILNFSLKKMSLQYVYKDWYKFINTVDEFLLNKNEI